MKLHKRAFFALGMALAASLMLTSCLGGNTTKIKIITTYGPQGSPLRDSYVAVAGATNPVSNSSLSTFFSGVTDIHGELVVSNLYVGANWIFTRQPSHNCPQYEQYPKSVQDKGMYYLPCGFGFREFLTNPSSIDFLNQPLTITLSDSLATFDPTYGMPSVSFYDLQGNLYMTVRAMSVSSDGSMVTIPGSISSSMITGDYPIVIRNMASDGSQSIAGGALVSITNNDPPPPPPPPDPGPGCGPTTDCPVLTAS